MATGSHLVSRLRSNSADKYKRRAQLRLSAVIVGLVFVNVFCGSLVIRSENLFNGVKMLLLAGFFIAGISMPMEWSRFDPANYVAPMGLIAGAMLIFLNYEGFELIANASAEIADPKRSLPIAYVGGVLRAIIDNDRHCGHCRDTND